MEKSLEIQSERADIETSSDDYARRFSGKVGKYFLEVQSNITLDLLRLLSGNKILDVGGGHAQLAVPLVENGYDVTVVGSDDKCQDRLTRFLKPSTYKYKTNNLLHLPFDNNSFDTVLAFRLLPHEKNWKILIKELCRVARTAVIVDYPDKRSFNVFYNLLFTIKKAYEGNTRPFKTFSRKELISEFQQNNFDSPTFKPEFFLPMVIHRVVKIVPVSKLLEGLFFGVGLRYLFGTPVILQALNQATGNE